MKTKRLLEWIFLLSCIAYTRNPVGKNKLNRIKNIRKLLVDFEREARQPWWKKGEPITLPCKVNEKPIDTLPPLHELEVPKLSQAIADDKGQEWAVGAAVFTLRSEGDKET